MLGGGGIKSEIKPSVFPLCTTLNKKEKRYKLRTKSFNSFTALICLCFFLLCYAICSLPVLNQHKNFLDANTSNYTQISSASQLASMSLSGNYILTKDIEISDTTWTPIGLEETAPFTGNLDGNGHTITFTATHNYTVTADSVYFGMFNYISNATISNLTVNWVSLTYTANAPKNHVNIHMGGIVAYATSSTIKNCTSKGAITVIPMCVDPGDGDVASSTCGGLVGNLEESSSIENCVNEATISEEGNGTGNFGGNGGIVGDIDSTSVVNMCVNKGEVKGGIAGHSYGVIKNCYNEGYVREGICTEGASGIITNCINYGKCRYDGITRRSQDRTYGNTIIIKNCINFGDAESSSSAGIIYDVEDGVTILNCYNFSYTTYGIALSNGATSSTTNSYYVKATSENVYEMTNGKLNIYDETNTLITPSDELYNFMLHGVNQKLAKDGLSTLDNSVLTSEDFTNENLWSTDSMWDFGEIWGINSELNNGFPVLQWLYIDYFSNFDLTIKCNNYKSQKFIVSITKLSQKGDEFMGQYFSIEEITTVLSSGTYEIAFIFGTYGNLTITENEDIEIENRKVILNLSSAFTLYYEIETPMFNSLVV